jgi:large subunit ribosomal protein L22
MATQTTKTKQAVRSSTKPSVVAKKKKAAALPSAEATIRYIHMAPQKVQRIVSLVRGLSVIDAEHLLASLPKRASLPVLKAVRSAAANAVHNQSMQREDLHISSINVGQSLVLPRFMPRAQGRVYRIRKRFSHIFVRVSPTSKPKKDSRAATQKSSSAKKPVQKKEPERAAAVIRQTKMK